jgi:hypothetical protein
MGSPTSLDFGPRRPTLNYVVPIESSYARLRRSTAPFAVTR